MFFEVDGFNAENLTVAFNDVDFCLKVQAKGYRNVWTPFAQLIHHELVSRGKDKTAAQNERSRSECDYIDRHWHDAIENDPFYNPNLITYFIKIMTWPNRRGGKSPGRK